MITIARLGTVIGLCRISFSVQYEFEIALARSKDSFTKLPIKIKQMLQSKMLKFTFYTPPSLRTSYTVSVSIPLHVSR